MRRAIGEDDINTWEKILCRGFPGLEGDIGYAKVKWVAALWVERMVEVGATRAQMKSAKRYGFGRGAYGSGMHN